MSTWNNIGIILEHERQYIQRIRKADKKKDQIRRWMQKTKRKKGREGGTNIGHRGGAGVHGRKG